MASARLIVSADDFGLTDGVCRAVLRGHRHGLVTATSLLAVGRSFDLAARMLALRGADAPIPEEYAARLTRELGVIVEMGFAGYFLIVADFIRWARANGVPELEPIIDVLSITIVLWALSLVQRAQLQVRVPSARAQPFVRLLAAEMDFLDRREYRAVDAQFELLRQELARARHAGRARRQS